MFLLFFFLLFLSQIHITPTNSYFLHSPVGSSWSPMDSNSHNTQRQILVCGLVGVHLESSWGPVDSNWTLHMIQYFNMALWLESVGLQLGSNRLQLTFKMHRVYIKVPIKALLGAYQSPMRVQLVLPLQIWSQYIAGWTWLDPSQSGLDMVGHGWAWLEFYWTPLDSSPPRLGTQWGGQTPLESNWGGGAV